MKKNKPFAAQPPAPAFANDPQGFWAGILNSNAVAGLASLLPGGTVIQSDVMAKARLLHGQIAWTPCPARWNGCNITISLADAQFLLDLAAGGSNQTGKATALVEKLQFGGFGKGMPDYGDTIKIQSGGVWHEFTITGIVGQFDDNDPGLVFMLDNDQNDDGN